MNVCRNCGAGNLRELGFIGALAPFFLRRVYRSEITARRPEVPWKRMLQRTTQFAHKLFSRVHPQVAAVEMQSCLACSFIQTRYPFPEEGINRLYSDYRSDSYNQERISYEPSYAAVVDRLGFHTEAGVGRVEALTKWLQSRMDIGTAAMLDFGGADGQFLPTFPGQHYVYEISNIAPAPGVIRISNESELHTYSYVQVAHVLEHVTEPLQLVKKITPLVATDGYLLVEVPQDLSNELIEQLRSGATNVTLPIHEHINYYSESAVRKLLEAAGLEIVAVEAVPVVSPVQKQNYIRGLARKTSQA